MLVCPNCGHDNPGNYVVCDKCGTRLSAADFGSGVVPGVPRAEGTDVPASSGGAEQDMQEAIRRRWATPPEDLPIGKETQSEVAKGASVTPMWFAVVFGVIIGTGGVRLFLDLGFWPTILLNAAIIGLLVPAAMIIQWLLNRLQGRG